MGNALQTLPQIPQQQQQQQSSNNDGGEGGGEEFTCEICIEPTSYSDKKFKNNDECSHPFCTDCMIKYIRVKLEDNNSASIRCPALSCDRELDPRACASLVGPSLFARWCDVLCQETILGLNRCYCPNRDCNALIVNECGGGGGGILGRSKCPQCKTSFCFDCGRVWHAGFTCGDNVDANDVAFGRLAERMKWMRCPRCRHFVELRDGCRVINCRCGSSFCYKCGDQFDCHRCRCDTAEGRCSEICFYVCYIACLFISGLVLWFIERKWPQKQA